MRLKSEKSIIGHAKIVEFLEKSIAGGNPAHAYLFLGPEQVGKSTVARWIAGALLHAEPPFNPPLERGENQVTALDSHPDISIVTRDRDEKTGNLKSNISIEQIRNLRERLSMSTMQGGHKVAFIEDADFMSIEASNAMLKTLEEPTSKTTIILTASNEVRLPATISSRCQTFRFGLVSADRTVKALVDQGQSQVQAEKIAAVSFGRPGAALKYMNDPELFSEHAQEVKSIQNLVDLPISARLKYVTENTPKGAAGREQVLAKFGTWERVLRDQLLSSLGCDELTAIKSRSQAKQPAQTLKTLHACRQALLKNTNPQLTLENFLINL
jgi:DNA polymerase III subunit delta'